MDLTTFFKMVYTYSRIFLKTLGFSDPAQTKARAFARMQTRLFRFSSVVGVAVQGFAESPNRNSLESKHYLFVITSEPPTSALQQDIENTVSYVNHRYGTNMEAVVVDAESFNRLHPPNAVQNSSRGGIEQWPF
jgi:hypothetical protein